MSDCEHNKSTFVVDEDGDADTREVCIICDDVDVQTIGGSMDVEGEET